MLNLINIFGLLGFIAALLWYYSKCTFNYWKNLNVKYKEPVPFFGNTAKFILMRESLHETFAELYKYFREDRYGGFFQMRKPTLLVNDPEIINNILIKDFKYFVNRDFDFAYVNKELNPLSAHLFLVDGDRWRVLRHKMSPVFTSGKLKCMYGQIFDCIKVLNKFIELDMLADSKDMNVKELFERFTIDVIGSCAFGIDCNSLSSNDEFRAMGTKVFKPRISNAIKMFLSTFSTKLLHVFHVTDFPKDVSDFFLNVVLDTVTFRRKHATNRNDFLQLLMELQNTSRDSKYGVDEQKQPIVNEEFDEIDVAANAFLFFAAGFETTASTLSFCLHELAINQDIQEKLRAEVENFKAGNGEKLTADCLKDFTYMDMVLSETLRKYPPVPVLFRECSDDYVIPDTKVPIPTGSKIMIPVYSIQHDWRYYPNPEQFDPERFTPEQKVERLNGTYMPFGDGPRYCIGKRFAFMEMKAALADILLKYNFSPCSKTEIPLTFKSGTVLLSTKNGIWVNISKRK